MAVNTSMMQLFSDIDIVENNLSHDKGDGCRQRCATDARCKAIVDVGDVCYMKSGVSNLVYKPGFELTAFVPSAAIKETFENQDLAGQDLFVYPNGGAVPERCAKLCHLAEGCRAFVHDTQTNHCYLKRQFVPTGLKAKPRVITYVI